MASHVCVAVRRGRLLGGRGRAIFDAGSVDAYGDVEPEPSPHRHQHHRQPERDLDRRLRHRRWRLPQLHGQGAPSWSSDGISSRNQTTSRVLGLSVWDVGRVARNACHWRGHLYDPGPTVDDLVAALAAQPMRNATTPIDVTLGGYHGEYLEWSVPTDMVVTGDSDFAGCSVFPSNGHRDFVSWFGNGYGERYQQVAGQVDRLWVLNVHGQRLVVDATYSPDTTEAERLELGQIAKSLRFASSCCVVDGDPGSGTPSRRPTARARFRDLPASRRGLRTGRASRT